MNFAGLLFLLLAHYCSGRGILALFRMRLAPAARFCICMITGVPLVSMAPCILQLLHLPIALIPVMVSVALLTLIYCLPLLRDFKRPVFRRLTWPVYYEWPFLIICSFLAAVSIWRCFFYPPHARDMLAGPELLAEFAVREQNMISSVFTVDLQTTNNYFKSPFITCLQILYKLLVCPFGQVWLSILAVFFWIWLYTILRERLHPIVAGFLLLVFMTIPELYSYSYILLYDFSNMIFFFGGFYFLARYFENKRQGDFLYAAFLFGIATYIRSETLVLVTLIIPLLIVFCYRQRIGLLRASRHAFLFLVIPAAFYFLYTDVFIRSFIPIPFNLKGELRSDFGNISALTGRMKDMNTFLIFSSLGITLFGYYIFLFCGVLLLDLVWFRKFNKEGRVALYGILVVYAGLPLLGYLLPLVDLQNTTKRGLFKLLPLLLFYFSNSSLFRYLSARLTAWEHASNE